MSLFTDAATWDTGYSVPSVANAPSDQGGFLSDVTDRLLQVADYWIEGEFGPTPVAQPSYLYDPYTYSNRAIQPAAVGFPTEVNNDSTNTLIMIGVGVAAIVGLVLLVK